MQRDLVYRLFLFYRNRFVIYKKIKLNPGYSYYRPYVNLYNKKVKKVGKKWDKFIYIWIKLWYIISCCRPLATTAHIRY